ncbi:histidine kinase [Fulvitalea axinellae]|uniref:Histidine kinase n=2 Tax=Fulvitalea axinellae TaxID=1182444 RepID=A0AAU9CGE8_9BACT|nr:histidine kinase [Fulvitalea axinellae]
MYATLALVMGVVHFLEDLSDKDNAPGRIVMEFLVIVIGLGVFLPLLGMFFCWVRKGWWDRFGRKENWNRILTAFVALYIVVLPPILAFPFLFIFKNPCSEDIWLVWASFFLFVSLTATVESVWLLVKRRRQLEELNSQLLRSHEMAKYQALMNQLNPHFLFNSLNVLSYMVHKDPMGAERFIEELSKIYRYILQLNEAYLVPLEKELDFIKSYVYLQKIRYGNNLIFESSIDSESIKKNIPPLTLEVLVENAIKHNALSESRPLRIRLQAKGKTLYVRNNIQIRNERVEKSTQVGLKNLKDKFLILEAPSPEFFIENDTFIAKIPLLDPEI